MRSWSEVEGLWGDTGNKRIKRHRYKSRDSGPRHTQYQRHFVRGLTQPATLLPLGEIFEAIGSAALCLLVLLDVPGQLGGDVGDEEAAGPQAVVVAPHPELAVLQQRRRISLQMSQMC